MELNSEMENGRPKMINGTKCLLVIIMLLVSSAVVGAETVGLHVHSNSSVETVQVRWYDKDAPTVISSQIITFNQTYYLNFFSPRREYRFYIVFPTGVNKPVIKKDYIVVGGLDKEVIHMTDLNAVDDRVLDIKDVIQILRSVSGGSSFYSLSDAIKILQILCGV